MRFRLGQSLMLWLLLCAAYGAADDPATVGVPVLFYTRSDVVPVVQVSCHNASIVSVYGINLYITDETGGGRLEASAHDKRVTVNHSSLSDVTVLNISGYVDSSDAAATRTDVYLLGETSALTCKCVYVSSQSSDDLEYPANFTVYNMTLLSCCVAHECPDDVSSEREVSGSASSRGNVCRTEVRDINKMEVRRFQRQSSSKKLLTRNSAWNSTYWAIGHSDAHPLLLYKHHSDVTESGASLQLYVSAWKEEQHSLYTCKVNANEDDCETKMVVISLHSPDSATQGQVEENTLKVALGVTVPVIMVLAVSLVLLLCRHLKRTRMYGQSENSEDTESAVELKSSPSS